MEKGVLWEKGHGLTHKHAYVSVVRAPTAHALTRVFMLTHIGSSSCFPKAPTYKDSANADVWQVSILDPLLPHDLWLFLCLHRRAVSGKTNGQLEVKLWSQQWSRIAYMIILDCSPDRWSNTDYLVDKQLNRKERDSRRPWLMFDQTVMAGWFGPSISNPAAIVGCS